MDLRVFRKHLCCCRTGHKNTAALADGERAVDWLFDLVRQVYDRFVDSIGQQGTIILFAALGAVAIYLAIGRGK